MNLTKFDAAQGRRVGQNRFVRPLAGIGMALAALTPIGVMAQSTDAPPPANPVQTPPDQAAIQPASPRQERQPGVHPPGSNTPNQPAQETKASTPPSTPPTQEPKTEPANIEKSESDAPAKADGEINNPPSQESGPPKLPPADKSAEAAPARPATDSPAPVSNSSQFETTAIQPASPTVEKTAGIHPPPGSSQGVQSGPITLPQNAMQNTPGQNNPQGTAVAPALQPGNALPSGTPWPKSRTGRPNPPTAVKGQTVSAPGSGGSGVQIQVRDVTTEGQLIRVPVNKSVLVDLSMPAREVRLAKPEFADVNFINPTQLILTGKSFGTTQLIMTFGERDQRVFDVAVDLELERLLASIRTAVPRGSIKAHALMDSVVLTGDVPDAEAAARIMEVAGVFSTKVLNHMRVSGTQQVLLRCTVAELSKSVTRQLGFNGWMGGENLRDMFFVNNLNQINPADIGAVAGANAAGVIPFATGSNGIPITGNTTLSLGFPRVQMQAFVQALRENGLLRVLAEPNLVAINGQSASFLAGGEIPIPISTSNTIDIKFKEFGVRLNFTPAVLSEDRIRLKVAPEVSEPDFTNSVTFGGISIPGFATRRVETTVELASGETIAIGGLLNERVRAITQTVPGLGDIPVLGALFRSVNYQSDESELVVLVTPEMVEGVSPDQVTFVPGENFVQPNDFELYLFGAQEGQPKNPTPSLQPRINQRWPVKAGDNYGNTAGKVRGPLGPSSGDEGK